MAITIILDDLMEYFARNFYISLETLIDYAI